MTTEQMILIRRIVTPIGCILMLLGIALLDPVLALSFYAMIALLFGFVFLRARRRDRSLPPKTKAEEIEGVKQFIHKAHRMDIFGALLFVYMVGVLLWIVGLTVPILLFVVGGVALWAERLLVEPRIWADLSRKHGFSLG
jgi:cytochrome b subunit of formate dehydrogenase